uniref:Uncharacterized protein n=1 Tax=Ciona savignyi TaxID=51511 RepID=H2ZKZ8_CIOSA
IFTTYWSRFADAGNPNSESRPTLAAVAEWPSYASKGDNILIKVAESVVQSNYRKEFCDLWDATGFYVNITDTVGQSTNAVPATTVTDSVTNSATDSATASVKQDKTTATTISLNQENTTSDAVKLSFNRFSIFLFLYFTLNILI